MKLLYVTDQLFLFGGAEKILTQKLNYWADVYRYEVTVVTSCQQNKPPFFKLSDKVSHVDLGINYPDGSLYHPKNFGRFKAHFSKLKALIQREQPDAVLVLSQRIPHLITPFASGKIPSFYELHTSWQGFQNLYQSLAKPYRLKTRLLQIITRFAEKRYSKIVYLNPTELAHFGARNGVVIPNFYDESTPIPVARRQQHVITLGRLSREKRYDRLLDAWALLDDRINGWELYIFGEGVERDTLEQQCNARTWRNPVYLPGATAQASQKLAEAAVYALSSEVETFPMALLEALSHGLPVVSFDCESGPRHIVTQDQDGLLVPPQNVTALSEALLKVMSDQETRDRMSENAARNVKRFNARSIMQQWDTLLKQSMARK